MKSAAPRPMTSALEFSVLTDDMMANLYLTQNPITSLQLLKVGIPNTSCAYNKLNIS